VSVGEANRFGHPHPEVVERWTGSGAALLRTDRDGALLLLPGPGKPVILRWRDGEWLSELR
jgi:competence protein ComEC